MVFFIFSAVPTEKKPEAVGNHTYAKKLADEEEAGWKSFLISTDVSFLPRSAFRLSEMFYVYPMDWVTAKGTWTDSE